MKGAASGSSSAADVAMDEPCRFIGTYHKESRQRLEVLRACGAISVDEWKCMAGTLKTLDKEMTRNCEEGPQTLEAIEVRQRELYAPCVEPLKGSVANCGLLSSGGNCLRGLCP